MTHTPLSTTTASFHTVVTRHPGAAEWVQQQLGHPVKTTTHLPLNQVDTGGCYYGVFPLNLAAAICDSGSECWAISVEMPPHLRGQELSAQQLTELKAQLIRYTVSIQDIHHPPHN